MRRLRRDLLADFVIALLVTIVTLTVTAGLGVIALIALPACATVVASFVWERTRRR